MTDEICGAECVDGTECQHSAESCPVPSHSDPSAENPHGRPNKLNLQRQEQIAQDVEQGKSLSLAARKAGVSPSTVIRWIQVGEDQEAGEYREFFERLTRALGHGQDTWESMLLEAAEDDPSTIMAVLKTQFPNEWGDVNRGEQSGQVVINTEANDTTEIDPETLEVQE